MPSARCLTPRGLEETARSFVTHPISQCSQLPQQEQPEVVTRLLVDFLKNWKG